MKKIKIDGVTSVEQVKILEEFNVDFICCNLDLFNTEPFRLNINEVLKIKQSITKAQLVIDIEILNVYSEAFGLVFYDFKKVENLIIALNISYIQIAGTHQLPSEFIDILDKYDIQLFDSYLLADRDSNMFSDVNNNYRTSTIFQPGLYADYFESWKRLKADNKPDYIYQDVLRFEEINKFCQHYKTFITIDFTKENINEIFKVLYNVNAITFIIPIDGFADITNHPYKFEQIIEVLNYCDIKKTE